MRFAIERTLFAASSEQKLSLSRRELQKSVTWRFSIAFGATSA